MAFLKAGDVTLTAFAFMIPFLSLMTDLVFMND